VRTPRRSNQRTRIADELARLDTFISAQGLHFRLRLAGEQISLSTVYRTLHLLADLGRLDCVREPGGERLYRHRPGSQHRHYLTCRHCGLTLVVDATVIEEWAEQLRIVAGFAHLEHAVELSGVCGECGSETPEQSLK
jgi:Fur family transcriptional regulator, ferric uptake regulator